jgi:hypothetical protein
LEENADKDMRQEELLSALSASRRFFGAREITHGKPPTAPSNPPSERAQNAVTGHFRGSAEWWRHPGRVGARTPSCLGFESGVRDFRWEHGAENMGVGFISNVQLVGFVTIFEN